MTEAEKMKIECLDKLNFKFYRQDLLIVIL